MKFKTYLKTLLIFLFALLAFNTFSNNVEVNIALRGDKVTDKQGCTYWITKSTKKRHNSSCRWYKKSKGYCTDEKVGIACKLCGG